VIYTSTCVARKNGVSVMVSKTTENVSPTVSALSNVLLLLLRNPESVIGKAIQLQGKNTEV
jgi:hypothetical protein